MKKICALFCSVVLLSFLAAGGASAQVALSFSGGNGAPLSITLDGPVSFVITTSAPVGFAPAFIFQNVGNVIPTLDSGGGTIAFNINSGALFPPLNLAATGTNGNDVTANDLFLFNLAAFPGVTLGDVVTLSAGTYVTSSNIAAAPPANGLYASFIISATDSRISTFAAPVAVPEPGSIALVSVGALGLIACGRRRLRAG